MNEFERGYVEQTAKYARRFGLGPDQFVVKTWVFNSPAEETTHREQLVREFKQMIELSQASLKGEAFYKPRKVFASMASLSDLTFEQMISVAMLNELHHETPDLAAKLLTEGETITTIRVDDLVRDISSMASRYSSYATIARLLPTMSLFEAVSV